ncbi:ANTAR domain-containing response regulator [Ponticaulis sp.]|uniref:ANTAR domain-containing response regulator n=1 Tax=Ponticaulis sp. TaxID=2020902 RepID=UPI000B6334CD|nr:ANTAR domain-containing protein [Ponticaulis sp.]MAI90579.1 hypothetical protein [Ponticaulis sp.]OUX99094.1 MAG: hypothetical protein CBB65_09080 [Hyphomonadaceae bacterium TMED5]|tara:strand:- start:3002 stop:3610 length:609 start_codon:yes stop_codon:yes gene_type:complete
MAKASCSSGPKIETESVVVVSLGGAPVDAVLSAFPENTCSTLSSTAFLSGHFSGFSSSTLLIISAADVSEDMLLRVKDLQSTSPCPVLIFAATASPEMAQNALRSGASSCVIDGLQPHRVETLAAISRERFEQNRALKQELEQTRGTLETRKIIDRAKSLIMEQRGLKESEAYELLRKTAMNQSKSMREVAESFLTVSGILG